MLASEYGWAMCDILWKVSLPEALRLQKLIKKRKSGEYRMLLGVYHADKPEELAKILEEEIGGETILDAPFDPESFSQFKAIVSSNSKIAVH